MNSSWDSEWPLRNMLTPCQLPGSVACLGSLWLFSVLLHSTVLLIAFLKMKIITFILTIKFFGVVLNFDSKAYVWPHLLNTAFSPRDWHFLLFHDIWLP